MEEYRVTARPKSDVDDPKRRLRSVTLDYERRTVRPPGSLHVFLVGRLEGGTGGGYVGGLIKGVSFGMRAAEHIARGLGR